MSYNLDKHNPAEGWYNQSSLTHFRTPQPSFADSILSTPPSSASHSQSMDVKELTLEELLSLAPDISEYIPVDDTSQPHSSHGEASRDDDDDVRIHIPNHPSQLYGVLKVQ